MKVEAKAPKKLHELVFRIYDSMLPRNCRTIDLGAGEGAFSLRLLKRGDSVLGVDSIDDWKVENVPFIKVNLDSVDFADNIVSKFGKFDAVVAIEIIEHLENPFAFVRECKKLLKKDGYLFITTPNVESMNSRVMFLIKGRLIYFDEYSTIRSAHITPVFSWKLDMALQEAGFEKNYDTYVLHEFTLGKHNVKGWIGGLISLLFYPFVRGNKRGGNRIVVARLKNVD